MKVLEGKERIQRGYNTFCSSDSRGGEAMSYAEATAARAGRAAMSATSSAVSVVGSGTSHVRRRFVSAS